MYTLSSLIVWDLLDVMHNGALMTIAVPIELASINDG